jgi:hypothetical protein
VTRLSTVLPIAITLLALTSVSLAARPTKRLTDEARGELLYDRHCIQCHGENAAGDGPLTPTLVVEVPDLRTVVSDATRADHVRVVLDGRRSMPSFRNAFDRFDAERVMRHMERIAEPGYIRPAPAPAAPAPRPGPPAVRSVDAKTGPPPEAGDGSDAPAEERAE